MEATKGYTRCQRLLALALAVIMTVGYIPVSGSAEELHLVSTRTDPPTLSRPEQIYGNNTMNAGKITVGKSVSDKPIKVDDDLTLSLTGSDNFLITVSQTAQVAGLSSQSSVPVDVVFVLDTSGSMDEHDRAETMVTAANTAIKSLMEAHPANRVAVVAFSSKGYGGGSNGQTEKATTVLSSLRHYSPQNNHLTWVDDDGTAYENNWIGDYIKGQNGYRHSKEGGTNIQAGIAAGAQILTGVTDTTWTNPDTGAVVNRIPFLILLSDGQPTFTYNTSDWYNPASDSSEQGPGSGSYEGNGFLAALTAAYYKGKITEKYYGNKASEDNRCYIYTVGVEIANLKDDNLNLANITLDPATYTTGTYAANNASSYWNYGNTANSERGKDNDYGWKTYWNSYLNNPQDGTTIRVNQTTTFFGTYDNNYTITKSSVDATNQYVNGFGYEGGIAYNDGYYDADDVSKLQEIFNSLLSTINEKALSAPTMVSGAPELSGYVTFTDPIGEFMDVKDIKGIYAHGILFDGSQAETYLNSGNAAFDAKLREILKVRLEMTNSQERIVNKLINGRRENKNIISDNSLTWWGKKIASSEESHVQCLGHATMTTDNMTDFIKSTKAPTIDGITADTLCRSYIFYGTDTNHDYMYFMVRVQQDLTAPYKQTVVVSAPASLLSVDEVMINEAADGSATAKIVSDDTPLRVIYEVGLRDDINHQNVSDIIRKEMPSYATESSNMSGTGTYLFYTNDWDRHVTDQDHHHRAMAKATFHAAIDNPFYAYQKDTPILVKNGNTYTQYNESAAPSGDDYYYARTYYDWNGSAANADGTYNAVKRTAYIPIGIASGETDIDRNSSGWYVKKGTYTSHSLIADREDVEKDTTSPIGALIVSHAHKTESSSDSHYTVLLGNNGVLSFNQMNTKEVYRTENGQLVNVDGKPVMVGDVLTYVIKVINSENNAVTASVTDQIPEGTAYVEGSAYVKDSTSHTFTVSADKKHLAWTGIPLAADTTTEVSFQVTVTEDAIHNSILTVDNKATVSLSNNSSYVTNTTKNPPEGKSATVAYNNSNSPTVTSPEGTQEEPLLKVGDRITYTIRFFNDKDAPATIRITDIIPAGTTFVDVNDDIYKRYHSHTGNQVSWVIPDVESGEGGSVSFTVYVDASAQTTDGKLNFSNNATLQIGNNNPRTTNTVKHTGDVGNISVKKVVTDIEGIGVDITNQDFTMTLSDAEQKLSGEYAVDYSDGTKGKVSFLNGVGNLILKDGQTAVVKNLPLGATISINEDTTNLPYWEDSYLNGKQSVVVTKDTGNTATPDVQVTNKFVIIPVDFQLTAKKTFGGSFPAGSYTFGFKAEECNSSGIVKADGRVATGTATKDSSNNLQTFTFSSRRFTAPTEENKPLYYLISENDPLNPSIVHDETKYLLELSIIFDGNTNRLKANARYSVLGKNDWKDPDEVTLTFNNYYPQETLPIYGIKNLKGRNINGSEFFFQLLDENDNVISTATLPEGTNAASANFQFQLTYGAEDMGKVFNYKVKEVAGSDEKITYDPTVYPVTVRVGNELTNEGKLVITTSHTVSEENTEIIFNNTYKNGVDVPISATKRFLNYADGPNYEEESTFFFEVVDKDDYTVSTASVTTANTNGSSDLSVNFPAIHISLDDMVDDSNQPVASKDFTYTIREVVPDLGKDYQITYDQRVFTASFTVKRNLSTGAMEFTQPVITDSNGNGAVASFVNAKNEETIPQQLKAKKTIYGNNLPSDLSFSFEVLKATVENGVVSFDPNKVEATGQSAPTKGDSSSSEQENTEQEQPSDDSSEDPMVLLSENSPSPYNETTNVNFTQLVYTLEEGRQNKTFYYIMKESNSGTVNGVTYDPVKYLVSLQVSLNNDKKLVVSDPVYKKLITGKAGDHLDHYTQVSADEVIFENTYEAKGHLNLTATKQYNLPMEGREFDFVLEGNGVTISGTNDAALTESSSGVYRANVSFATLNFSTTSLSDTYKVSSDTNTTIWRIPYTMKEIKPNNEMIPGVAYDSTTYPIVVEVTQVTGSNQLTAKLYSVGSESATSDTHTGIVFTNTYSVQNSLDVPFGGIKDLEGRDLQAGEFTFVLYHVVDSNTEKTVAITKNDADGNFSFTRHISADTLPIDKGTQRAIIYHLAEEGAMPEGVTGDSTDYYIKVLISHTNDAKYVLDSVTYHSNKECTAPLPNGMTVPTFYNTFTPEPVYAAPTASKELLDKDSNKLSIADGQFTFQAIPMTQNIDGTFTVNTTADPDAYSTGFSNAANADSSSSVTFSKVRFTQPGNYYFKLTEVAGTDPLITYSGEDYYWHVTVTADEQSGELQIAQKYYQTYDATAETKFQGLVGENDTVVFQNHKGNGRVDFKLELNKELHVHDANGAFLHKESLTGGEYDFVVTGPVINKAAPDNSNSGTDTTDNGEENLPDDSGNTPKPDEIITQVATGTNGVANDDNNNTAPINFETITITLDQFNVHNKDDHDNDPNSTTFEYTVAELPVGEDVHISTEIDPYTIKAQVKVKKDPHNNLSLDGDIVYEKQGQVGSEGHNVFVNHYQYTSTSLAISGTKVLRGMNLTNGTKFTFELSGHNLSEPLTAQNNANGIFTFAPIVFLHPGEFTYTVKETDDPNGTYGSFTMDEDVFTVKVTVTVDKEGKLHAVPMYYMSGNPVSGGQTPDGEQTTNPEGNQTTGNTLTAVGGISFTNLYTPDPVTLDLSTVISVKKVIKDTLGNTMNMTPAGFLFEMISANGETLTATSDTNGVIDFGELSFPSAGIYHYYIQESANQPDGLKHYLTDSNLWMAEIVVKYNSDEGRLYIDSNDVKVVPVARTVAEDTSTTAEEETTSQITFTNVYNPKDCQIEIVIDKNLTGRNLNAGEFTFHLHDGKRLVAEASNASNGDVVFRIPYTGADLNLPGEDAVDGNERIFTYIIHEVKGDVGGVIYDPDGVIEDFNGSIDETSNKGIKVQVTLSDNNGELSASDVVTSEKKTFENSYVPTPVTPEFTAMKYMEGRTLKEHSFYFFLEGDNPDPENKKPVQYRGYNLADGTIVFDEDQLPEFTRAGTYNYTLREDIPDAKVDGMTYDDTVLDVVFTVTDDLKGNLSVSVTSSDVLSFYNSYEGKPVEDVVLSAKKVLETDSNRSMKVGEFTFQLLDAQGNVIDTKKNDVNGNIYFNPLWFDAAGNYSFTIREVAGTEKGMVYDDTVHKVTVTVKPDENGDFTAQVSYDGKTTPPTFTNKFTAEPISVALTAQKKLNGRTLKDQEFKFTVYDSNGNKLLSGSNNTAGQISFQPLTFIKAGVYNYTIKENIGLSAYVQYDRKSYDVTVTVTDTDGVLSAVVTYPEDGITFRNYYDPSGGILPQTGEQLPLLALLCMAVLTPIALIFGCFFYFRKKRRA